MLKRELLVRQNTWQKSALCISGPVPKSHGSFLNVTTNAEDGVGMTKGTLEEWWTNSKAVTIFASLGGEKSREESWCQLEEGTS